MSQKTSKKRTDAEREKHRLYMREWRAKRKSQPGTKKAKSKPVSKGKKTKQKKKVSIGSFKPKNIKLSELTAEQYREYRRLYMRSYRLRKKINELNTKKPKGWRTKRSDIYKDLVEVNKEAKGFFKDIGGKYERVERVESGYDEETNILTSTPTVWQFENRLRDYLKKGQFVYYNFVDLQKTYNINIHNISTILMAWDEVLNSAYEFGGTSPYVNVYENMAKDKLTVEVTY
jgi:hypothetical protein